jgi:hypothetical protein
MQKYEFKLKSFNRRDRKEGAKSAKKKYMSLTLRPLRQTLRTLRFMDFS